MGDAKAGPVRLSFDPQLRVELGKRLGLDPLIEQHASRTRGDEDTNDAERPG